MESLGSRFDQTPPLEEPLIHSLYSEEMGFAMLSQHLVRVYLSSETSKAQDLASLAIQETLKVFEFDGEYSGHDPNVFAEARSLSPLGVRLWQRLDVDNRKLIHPFLTSSYKQLSVPERRRVGTVSAPVFFFSFGTQFVSFLMGLRLTSA